MIISVVIIMKNEENCIQKCLSAALLALNDFLAPFEYEVIVVDSDSSDNSIQMAAAVFDRYCVQNYEIIKVTNAAHTAALGRDIGKQRSRGKYVLFLDADMYIFKNFIRDGIKVINEKSNLNCSGIVGKRIDYFPQSKRVIYHKRRIEKDSSTTFTGGGVLFIRENINEVSFIRRQKTNEEQTLALFLKKRGRKIFYLDKYMYIHCNYKNEKKSLLSKIKRGSFLQGESFAILLKEYVKRFGFFSVFLDLKNINIKLILQSVILLLSLLSIISNKLLIALIIITAYFLIYRSESFLIISVFLNLIYSKKETVVKIELLNKRKCL